MNRLAAQTLAKRDQLNRRDSVTTIGSSGNATASCIMLRTFFFAKLRQ